MKIQNSELILSGEGRIYHLNIQKENIAPTIILVGDPQRVPVVSAHFDKVEFTAHKREFVTHTGYYQGKRLSVVSTGIGPDNIDIVLNELDALFNGKNFKADYKILNSEVRKLGYNIPPLVNAYMNLSPTMKLFGTAINYGFGEVEETGILISVDEIFEEKRIRHIESFADEHPESLEFTSGANHVIYKEK